MEIKQAEPHEFAELCALFEKSLKANGNTSKKRLSYALASGSAFVARNPSGKLEGAIALDRDLMNHYRATLIEATTKQGYLALLKASISFAGGTLFIENPSNRPQLEESLAESGFTECGEVAISSQSKIKLLSSSS